MKMLYALCVFAACAAFCGCCKAEQAKTWITASPPQKEVSGGEVKQADADTNRLSVAAFRITARPALSSASKEPRPGKGGGDGGMAAEGAPAREFRMMFDIAARARASSLSRRPTARSTTARRMDWDAARAAKVARKKEAVNGQ